MWGKIQRLLEDRIEKMDSLKLDTVQLRSANQRAIEDNRIQNILTEQHICTVQRECDIKVQCIQYHPASFTSCDPVFTHVWYRFRNWRAALQACKSS
jgi:hypothetical protein